MKKTLIALFVAASVFTSCTKSNISGSDDKSTILSGEDNPNHGGGDNVASTSIPQPVLSAFTQSFPSAMRIEWKKNSDGNYKVEFYVNGVKWQVIYSPSGTGLKMEHK